MSDSTNPVEGDQASPFWATFGKVAAVLGALGTGFGLYTQIWPNEARVNARCQRSEIKLPTPGLSEQHRKLLFQAVLGGRPEDEKTPTGTVGAAAKSIVDTYERDARWVSVPRMRVACRVSNAGGKLASRLALVFPLSIADARMSNGSHVVDRGSLDMGDLRPGDEREVDVWFDEAFLSENEVRLAHADGRGSVEFATPSYGLAGRFAANPASTLLSLLLWPTMIVMWVGIARDVLKARKQGRAAASKPSTQ